MTANRSTRAAGNQSGDVPTAAQSINFDARDTLEGRHDGTTVAQAVKEPGFEGKTPTPDTASPRFQNAETADSAEVGQ